MSIVMVEPVPDHAVIMRHTYTCVDCGRSAKFDVAKKGVGE